MPSSRKLDSDLDPHTRRAAGAARVAWTISAAYVLVAVVAIAFLVG